MIEFSRSASFSHINLSNAANAPSGKRNNEGAAAEDNDSRGNRAAPPISAVESDALRVKTDLGRKESVQPDEAATALSLEPRFKGDVSEASVSLEGDSYKFRQPSATFGSDLLSSLVDGSKSGDVTQTQSAEIHSEESAKFSPRISQLQSLLQNVNRPDASEIIGTQVSVRT